MNKRSLAPTVAELNSDRKRGAHNLRVKSLVCFSLLDRFFRQFATLRMAWAEDRAMLGSNPGADPGAKTEVGGDELSNLSPPCLSLNTQLRDWHSSDKSRSAAGRRAKFRPISWHIK